MGWIVGLIFFVVLVTVFPRQIVGLLFLGIAVAGGVWGYATWSDNQRLKEEAKIVPFADASEARCIDRQFPVNVSFTNTSNRTVDNVSFVLTAKQPGFSANRYIKFSNSDKILQPQQVYSACYSLDQHSFVGGQANDDSVRSLAWDVKVLSVRFAQ